MEALKQCRNKLRDHQPTRMRLIATEAAKVSVALVKGEKINFKAEKAEGGIEQTLLDPIVITKENMDLLVKDNFYTKAQLGLK